MARKRYEPQPFVQDVNGCVVAVLANVARMLDGDQSTFETVGRELERTPGQPVSLEAHFRWALETRGYSVKNVSPFSYERLRAEGPDSILDFYPYSNDHPTLRAYYERNLDDILARYDRRKAWLHPYVSAGMYVEEVRQVTVDDIDVALDAGSPIHLQVFFGPSNPPHAVLVYGRKRDGTYQLFYPWYEYDEGSAFESFARKDMSACCAHANSMTIYSRCG